MAERTPKYRYTEEEAALAEGLTPPAPPAAARSALRSESTHGRVRKRKGGSTLNRFHVDAWKIPPGWSYEWKRHTLAGQQDPAYAVEMAEQGWEAVPVDRHPEFMPSGWTGPILRDGMLLMERPIELTREAQEEDMANARMTVRINEARLNGTPAGSFDRTKASVRHEHTDGLAESFEIPG